MKAIHSIRVGLALALAAASIPAFADTFPDRPIKLVVGYSAGGGSDNLARTLAKGMSERLKQPVIVENRPGASTIIAAQAVQSSKADGYTIFQVDPGTLTMNQFLFKSLPYDASQFEPIAQTAVNPIGLLVAKNSKYQTVADLVEAAKTKRVTVASAGPGNITHLAMEIFQRRAGIEFTHVPYKGSAPALQALMAGEVEAYFSDVPSAISFVRGDKLKYLAVASPKRIDALPTVQTFQEAGYADFTVAAWIGIVAPKNMDAAVSRKLASAILETVNTPEVTAWMKQQSNEPTPRDGATFGALIQSDTVKYGSVIKAINLKLD